MLSDAAKIQFKIDRDPFKDDVNGEEDVFITPEIRQVRNAMFMTATLGGILVMGRRTYESIGRPLPGRETIVLTRGHMGRRNHNIAVRVEAPLSPAAKTAIQRAE